MTVKWVQQWAASAPSPTHPERNEDGWWIAATSQAAAVIDGMGGYRRQTATGVVGGEHAAQLAVEVLRRELDNWDAAIALAQARPHLRRAVEAVNRAIWEQLNWGGQIPAAENPEGKPADELSVGVALTLVALCDGGSRAVAAQQGDTHGYARKDVGLLQITEDQDLMAWDKINGVLTDEEAARITHELDNFDGSNLLAMLDQSMMRYFFDKNIFGALGVSGECPATGWSVIKLRPGDGLVLLSDGAYSNMSLPELSDLLNYPGDAARVVVELAQQRSVLSRFPDPHDPSKPFNLRATQDDMTAVVLVVGTDTPPTPVHSTEATLEPESHEAEPSDTAPLVPISEADTQPLLGEESVE